MTIKIDRKAVKNEVTIERIRDYLELRDSWSYLDITMGMIFYFFAFQLMSCFMAWAGAGMQEMVGDPSTLV